MREKKAAGQYLIIYTAMFAALSLLAFFPFLLTGKSMIGNGDGQSQYILQLEYMGRYLREWAFGCMHGDFIPARYDFTIGMGDDISAIVRFHPLDFLAAFVPSAHTEALYHVLIFLRLYLAGLAFSFFAAAWKSGFCRREASDGGMQWGILAGCAAYLFNGYTFSLGIVHPIYLSPLITLPLLLYAAERIMNGEGKYRFGLLTVMTALCFISNYYFMFIESVALLFYVLVRFFQMHAGMGAPAKTKALVLLFFRMIVPYAAGLMLSAVTLFPVLSRYLSSYRSERISEVNNLLVYADKRRYIAWLVNLISPLRASGNGTHLNYVVVVLAAVFLLFFVRKDYAAHGHQSRTGQFLRICAIAVWLCLMIPAGGYLMAVMNNENNRWVFLIALVLAGAVSYEWEDLIDPGKRGRRGLMLLAAAFDLMVLAESVIMGADIYNIAAAVELTVFTAGLVFFSGREEDGNRKKRTLLFLMAAVVISAGINGWMTFAPRFGNLVQYYMKAGSSLKTYEASVYSDYLQIDDDSFYRTDGLFSGNTEDNAALYLGYPGVQMYNSVLNRDEVRALLLTGSPGLTTMLHVHNLDGHTPMSALAGVKYFLADEDNRRCVPAGYDETPVWTNAQRSIYENRYPAGMISGREAVLPESALEALNPVEREYAMLHAAVVPDEEIPQTAKTLSVQDIRDVFGVEDVPVNLPDGLEGIGRTDTGYIVKDTRAVLSLDVPVRKGAECYLLFEGLHAKQSEKMRVRAEGISKSVTLLDDGAQYTMGRTDYAVRLGSWKEDGVFPVRIRFTKKGAVDIARIRTVYVDEEKTLSALTAMQGALPDVRAGKDEVTIRLTADTDGMQAISIPYSAGWSAEADGEKTALVRTDLCFMGVFLKKGVREIRLTYHSPGLKMGLWTAAGGILLILVLIVVRELCAKEFGKKEIGKRDGS